MDSEMGLAYTDSWQAAAISFDRKDALQFEPRYRKRLTTKLPLIISNSAQNAVSTSAI